jgi:hypothetical protein
MYQAVIWILKIRVHKRTKKLTVSDTVPNAWTSVASPENGNAQTETSFVNREFVLLQMLIFLQALHRAGSRVAG